MKRIQKINKWNNYLENLNKLMLPLKMNQHIKLLNFDSVVSAIENLLLIDYKYIKMLVKAKQSQEFNYSKR
jgi:hypothetical protein